MKAKALAVFAVGTVSCFLQMMLPKRTMKTRGRSESSGLWENLKGQDSQGSSIWGWGTSEEIRETGWKESRIRILRNEAEDITGR